MRPIFDLTSAFADQIDTARAESRRVYEPVIGVVTDNKDPSKLGRVKVKVPVLVEGETSWWAPIIMLGAGKNRGWFFIPEKDDEVLVIFEHGDMDRPLVVGALWGGKDKPPDKNPGGNPRRVIKSREGSKVIFDDEKNKLIFEDGTGKGRITFEADANKITIESLVGDVCFQAPTGDIVIVAKELEIKATSNLEIHVGSNQSFGTDGKVTLKGSDVTFSGSTSSDNCGGAQAPSAPELTPKEIPDPYGS
jgi:uncharacterized protein involved in type VI secretion and phage assembly